MTFKYAYIHASKQVSTNTYILYIHYIYICFHDCTFAVNFNIRPECSVHPLQIPEGRKYSFANILAKLLLWRMYVLVKNPYYTRTIYTVIRLCIYVLTFILFWQCPST